MSHNGIHRILLYWLVGDIFFKFQWVHVFFGASCPRRSIRLAGSERSTVREGGINRKLAAATPDAAQPILTLWRLEATHFGKQLSKSLGRRQRNKVFINTCGSWGGLKRRNKHCKHTSIQLPRISNKLFAYYVEVPSAKFSSTRIPQVLIRTNNSRNYCNDSLLLLRKNEGNIQKY